jgi:NAD(P)-dependent dehydrogenase (short-subunit alcohol dehydrogenase family)
VASCSAARFEDEARRRGRADKLATKDVVTGTFAGETVIVTGAARGLGRGIASAFLDEGADVVLVDVNGPRLEATTQQLGESAGDRVLGLPADVAKPQDIAHVVETSLQWRGKIEHLINNAGIVRIAPLVEVTESDWDQVMAVNLKGVYLGMRAVLPHMLERQTGSIVSIASQAGKRGNPYIAPYCASKAGVISLTQTAALEAAPYVRVNCVCPGFINTELQEEEYDEVAAITGQDRDEIKQSWIGAMPLRRFQEVEDVAASVLYLSSPAASQTTGEAMNVSGGLVMD